MKRETSPITILIVLPDVAALRGQLRLLFPNEKVEVRRQGPPFY